MYPTIEEQQVLNEIERENEGENEGENESEYEELEFLSSFTLSQELQIARLEEQIRREEAEAEYERTPQWVRDMREELLAIEAAESDDDEYEYVDMRESFHQYLAAKN